MTDIVVVGEAWGEHEERERTPFCGAAGYELTKMLTDAGIHRSECFLTNVFNLRPPGNQIKTLCGPKPTALPGYPGLIEGKYIRSEFASELRRLGDEVLEVNPNLIICLGNTACWALLGKTAITNLRGTTHVSTHTVGDYKVLPTYHPAAVLRQWELRPIVVMDLIKAKRESTHPDIRRPKRRIFVPETIGDLYDLDRTYLQRASRIAVDIETAGHQITVIGFAPSKTAAVVVPFVEPKRAGRSYWPTYADELAAWKVVRDILSRNTGKVFQNGLFDIAFLWRAYAIKVANAEHDTMLLHHALQPESLKGLGFLGSIYTDESNWKLMRKSTTIKRDE